MDRLRGDVLEFRFRERGAPALGLLGFRRVRVLSGAEQLDLADEAVEVQGDLHDAELTHHSVTDVVGDDGLDVVVEEEAGDPGVVTRRAALVVTDAPVDLVLLPGAHLPTLDVDDGEAVGATPPGVDGSIGQDGHARDHSSMVGPQSRVSLL